MNKIVEKLKEFGFNSYESKVYLALLKKYPSTGYEVSQIADIPQSRAYDALKSLAAEKIVIADNDKPQKYSPISPKELTQRFKRRMLSAIDYLDSKLPNIKEDYNEPLHNISGYENILEKVKEIINNAKNSIYIEIWDEDYKHIEKEISDAYDREVDIKFVGLGNLKTKYGLLYNHPGAKEIEHTAGSRLIYLLSDGRESLFGKIEYEVSWSKNIDVAFLLLNFIIHDMYLLDVGQNFPEQLKYFYGAGMKNLKNKIISKDLKMNIH